MNMTETQKDRHMGHKALFTDLPCPQCIASIAREQEGHGPDCVDVVNHEGCNNGYPCRDTSPQGEEPPDVYHECDSAEHHVQDGGDT